MRKTLIYLILAIRAVLLCAVTSVGNLVSRFPVMVASSFRTGLILLFFLTAFNFQAFAQNSLPEDCIPGERYCRGDCRPARQCGGPPPPPGLPIDSKLPYLLIAGLGLGIYYWRSKKIA
jgi:hypothetical protein